jgi:hypothetical protein
MMVADDKELRKQTFQQLLDGADDDFFGWAANRLHTEAEMRFVLLPCHPEHPAQKYLGVPAKAVKVTQQTTKPLKSLKATVGAIKPAKAAMLEFDLTNAAAGSETKIHTSAEHLVKKNGKVLQHWVIPVHAPIVKNKAAHEVSFHLAHGAHVQYQKYGPVKRGIIMKFSGSSAYIKPDGLAIPTKVLYANILLVDVLSAPAYKKYL